MWPPSKSTHNDRSSWSRADNNGICVPQPLQAEAGSPTTENDGGPESIKTPQKAARPPNPGRMQRMSGDPINERSRHMSQPLPAARRLHSFFSSPSSSKINQSQSYSERSQHRATRTKNTSISSKEFLGKAAIRSDRSIVSSSADIPETEAAAQAHIQAIRNEKREYSGGRNARDLEAALEL
jgi:hypothetical protein